MKKECVDNGLVIEFPNENCTKIDGSKYFEKFSGLLNNFKVMDCSWLGNNTLWLIELKRYYNPDNDRYIEPDFSQKNILAGKIMELLQKSVGTLLLLNQRHETIKLFANNINKDTKINIVHILKVKPEHKEYLQFIKDKLKARFDELPLTINSLVVIDYDMKNLLEFVE
jgi:hypothetical protein